MKKHLWLIALLCLPFVHTLSTAQSNQPLIIPKEAIAEGNQLLEEGRYEEALEVFQQISPEDTAYTDALNKIAITKSALEDYEGALDVASKGIQHEPSFLNFYHTKINALNNLNKNDEALAACDQAIKQFPFHQDFYFDKAIVHIQLENLDEATALLQHSIRLNPFEAKSHYFLGLIAAEKGRLVPAVLSLQTFIQLEPTTERTQEALSYVGSLLQLKFEASVEDDYDSPFKEVTLILESKAAMSEEYKSLVKKVDDPVIKQTQAMCEKIKYKPGTDDFWMETYVKFFTKLIPDEHFEAFCLRMLLTIENKTVGKRVKKNIDDIRHMSTVVGNALSNNGVVMTSPVNGKDVKGQHWFEYGTSPADGEPVRYLSAIGSVEDPDNPDADRTGEWLFFDISNRMVAKGEFQQSKKEGEWIRFHDNGRMAYTEEYEAGKLQGPTTHYHENGEKAIEATFEDDELQGILKRYNKSGVLSKEEHYKDGELDGTAKEYYADGTLKGAYNFNEGKMEGELIQYYHNGNKKRRSQWASGKETGLYEAWYPNKVLEITGTMEEDEQIGVWNFYHRNGTLSKTLPFNAEGERDGILEIRAYDGTPTFKGSYEDGKEEGPHKTFREDDGTLKSTFSYKKGSLSSYTYFDRKGNTLHKGTSSKKGTDIKYVHANGATGAEGMRDPEDEKHGEWTYYFYNGIKRSTESFDHGDNNAPVKHYFITGGPDVEIPFKDGKRNGYYKSWYKNEKLYAEGWYKDGEKEGYWHYYNADGTPQSTSYYINGTKHGTSREFHNDGTPYRNIRYKDGDAVSYVYFDTSGTEMKTLEFPKLKGEYVEYAADGTPVYKGTFINGEYYGKGTRFFTDGTVSQRRNYVEGNNHGHTQGFYRNGDKKFDIFYLHGKKDSTWTYYHENGKISSKHHYRNGHNTDTSAWYYENGQVEKEITYLDDEIHGTVKKYNPSGDLIIVKYFKYDVFTGYTYTGEDGELVDMIPVDTGKFTVEAFYANGNTSYKEELYNSEYHGKRNVFYTDGTPFIEASFENGKREGEQKEYFSNGRLKSSVNYYYSDKHEKAQYYHENGKLAREESYLLDDRHGTWTYYDKKGEVTKTEEYLYDHLMR